MANQNLNLSADEIAKQNIIARASVKGAGGISNTLTASGWSDAIFREKYYSKTQAELRKRVDLTSGANTALRVAAWYVGVDSLSKDEFIAAFMTLMAIAKIENQYIFPEGTREGAVYSTAIKTVTTYRFPSSETKLQVGDKTVKADDAKRFYEELVKAVVEEPSNESRQLVVNLISFLFLNLLRLLRKDMAALAVHICTSAYQSFRSLYGIELDYTFVPPSESAFKDLDRYLSPNGPTGKMFIALCVQSWITNQEALGILGFLKAGCLLSLGENGLGAVAWSLKAARTLRIELNAYLTYCLLDSSLLEQCYEVAKFVIEKDKGLSWPWCRLFDESALAQLSNSHAPELSIIGALICMEDEDTVTDMPQFQGIKNLIPGMIRYARAVREAIKPDVPDKAKSVEAQRALEILNANRDNFVTMKRTRKMATKRRGLDQDEQDTKEDEWD